MWPDRTVGTSVWVQYMRVCMQHIPVAINMELYIPVRSHISYSIIGNSYQRPIPKSETPRVCSLNEMSGKSSVLRLTLINLTPCARTFALSTSIHTVSQRTAEDRIDFRQPSTRGHSYPLHTRTSRIRIE